MSIDNEINDNSFVLANTYTGHDNWGDNARKRMFRPVAHYLIDKYGDKSYKNLPSSYDFENQERFLVNIIDGIYRWQKPGIRYDLSWELGMIADSFDISVTLLFNDEGLPDYLRPAGLK